MIYHSSTYLGTDLSRNLCKHMFQLNTLWKEEHFVHKIKLF